MLTTLQNEPTKLSLKKLCDEVIENEHQVEDMENELDGGRND